VGLALVSRYGQRDQVRWGALVPRPDGTAFVQGFLDSYRRVEVPMVPPPETRANRLDNVRRAPGKEGSMANTMAQAVLDSVDVIHRYEVSRELSESGRAWLVTLQGPGGQTCVVSRLRSSREGNGF